jgi:dephospho-CoA kinase
LIGGRPDGIDLIVLIVSNKSKRIGRVVERDGVTGSDVESRDEKQPDFDQLTHLADYLITNDGTLKELETQAEQLYNEIIE